MLPPFKHQSVNWVDGMKINKDHFEQTDSFVKELVRDTAALSLNQYNYGLCPSSSDNTNPLNIKLSIDPTKYIRVQLLSCRAVTPGGMRIEFGQDHQLKVNTEIEKLTAEYNFDETREKNFYVILLVNSLARIPAGRPDPDETPPRFPFIMPDYQLQILPESMVSLSPPAANSIVVGMLQYQTGKMRVLDHYIPPCMTVNSYAPLQDAYYRMGNLMGETGRNITSIIEKIHGKSQSTSLVKSCLFLCNRVSDFIADNMGSYRWIAGNQPPIFMLEYFLRLSYNISMSLSNIPVKDKEELINYICEWIDEGPSDINEKINGLIRSEYQHNDISGTLLLAEEFMQLVHAIFLKLSQLDFIGKHKERLFVKEDSPAINEITPPENVRKKGWSFLPD